LKRFVADSDESRRVIYRSRIDRLASQLGVARGSIRDGLIPRLVIEIPNAAEACLRLQLGNPSVYVDASRAADGVISISPACLRDDELDALARRLREVVG